MAHNMRNRINQFTAGNVPGYQRVAIQLFGMMGHGKSSLINSCLCVVKDLKYKNLAGAGTSDGAITKRRQIHELTNTLIIVDNRGFNKLNREELMEACAQLRSLRDIGQVTWEKDNLKETLEQLPKKYTNHPADFILPVLVYSATQTFNSEENAAILELITNSFDITGVQPVVVITRCPLDKAEEMRKKFGDLGAMQRICLENYTVNNSDRTAETDQNILEFLSMCIQEAERALEMRQNEDPQTRFVIQATEQIKLESDILRKEKKEVKVAAKEGICKQQ